MNRNEIVEKAKEICNQHGIASYPVNIVDLCNKHGLKVFEECLPPNVAGFIVVQKENFNKYNTNKLIVVNTANSPGRKRFTIAHELGHYVLHNKSGELYAHRDAGQSGGIETEANVFASCVLMPESAIDEAVQELKESFWGDIDDASLVHYISERFAVSNEAATVRLRQLKVI